MTTDVSVLSADGHEVMGSYTAADRETGIALLVHGITADRHEWGFYDFLVEKLAARGISTLAIDYRGHGKSAIPILELSLSGVFLDIDAAWKFCLGRAKAKSGKAIIVGNSFGGGVALLYASTNKSFSDVICTCPVFSYIDDLSRVNPNWKVRDGTSTIQYASKVLSKKIIPEMCAFDMLIDSESRDIKMTVFHGSADSDVPISCSEKFVSDRRHAQLVILNGMDHSFSAPEGTINKEATTRRFREEAASAIANHLTRGD